MKCGLLAPRGYWGPTVVRKWNGKYGEIHTYRYANQLALRKEQPAMQVNWLRVDGQAGRYRGAALPERLHHRFRGRGDQC